jgi:dihydroorotase
MSLLIKNGRVIDPASNTDSNLDIFIEGNKISKIAPEINAFADTVIDAWGLVVVPGFVDIHVHFRQPGRDELETIVGGARVAARSGYTTVCVMPNTNPCIDTLDMIDFIKKESAKSGINIFPVAAVTKNRAGQELVDIKKLFSGGSVAFTDDGFPIMNAKVMREALILAKECDAAIFVHEEDKALAYGGAMNEGVLSQELSVQGIPREAEEIMIARDILLARLTGGHVHIQHLSSGGSVDLVRDAKKKGINITAETAPHYFTLTEHDVRTKGSNAKMSPSLREEKDRRAIIEGLRDGTIDTIATDHAPHSEEDKARGLASAPNGVIGLETALPLVITRLVKEEKFPLIDAIRLLTLNPCKVIRSNRGRIAENGFADITIIDPEKKVTIDRDYLISKYKNCPFIGMELFGEVKMTVCDGKIVYNKDQSLF